MLLVFACFAVSFTAKAQGRVLTVPDQYPTVEDAVNAASDGDNVYIKKGIYDCVVNQTLVINKIITITGQDAAVTVLNLNPPLVEKNIFTYLLHGLRRPNQRPSSKRADYRIKH